MNGRRRQLLAIGVLAIALPALAGCGSASDDAEQTALAAIATPLAAAPPSSSSSSGSSKPPKPCPSDPTASLRPPRTLPRPGAMPPRSLMARVRRRDVLKAGVDQNTLFARVPTAFDHDHPGLRDRPGARDRPRDHRRPQQGRSEGGDDRQSF
jgi:hypothetical protein